MESKKFNIGDSIFVVGHRGMVGTAVLKNLQGKGFQNLLTASRNELDLCDGAVVHSFFKERRPDHVIVAAAKVGGIYANATYPAEFIYENLSIALNVIHAAHLAGVRRLLFLGSSCIYPRDASQPMTEEALLTGPLETTNEAYALAKIAGLKLCQFYRQQYDDLFYSAMPTNLYGPGDNYHPENSHVIPALLRRFHEAKEGGHSEVVLWGSGTPRREFLHVDDLAEAVYHLMQLECPPDLVNVGTGTDVSILELARSISEVVGFEGEILLDPTKPDGTPRKLLDISLINKTGWRPRIGLDEGLKSTYQNFLSEQTAGSLRT